MMDSMEDILTKVSTELDSCMNFWLKYSHDNEKGGFYNCLTSSGSVYDTTKYCWLQGRQVWMYSTLYQEVERFRLSEVYDAAIMGGEFLIKFAKNEDSGKCYFSLTRSGEPVKVQRTIFSEVFYVMAMSSLYSLTSQEKYKVEACEMMSRMEYWVGEGASELGRPQLSGQEVSSSLAVPMCILSLLPMVEKLGWVRPGLEESCVKEILLHYDKEKKVVLENVVLEGQKMEGVAGRLMNPGHAIECGWFLLQHAEKTGEKDLARTAVEDFIKTPLSYGWDKEQGGIFYFMDAEGFSPTALEWDMKLWWVHLEAMVATLMVFNNTRQEEDWDRFRKVFKYSFEHFPLPGGEWAGYLDRQGKVKMDFKGGPFKGCFHLPRALMICENILKCLKN